MRSQLGEPAHLTGPAHHHMKSPLAKTEFHLRYFLWKFPKLSQQTKIFSKLERMSPILPQLISLCVFNLISGNNLWVLGLKCSIFAGAYFLKFSGFYLKQGRQLLYYKGATPYIPLSIPEILNRVSFQNSSKWLPLTISQQLNMLKVDRKKDTRTVSVDVIRMPL